MPFLANQTDEELKKQQAEQAGGQSISGQSSVLNAGAAPAQKAPASSGSFQNLNTFLDANKDNTADMANKISSDVGASANAANAAADTVKSGITDTTVETADSLNTKFYNDPGAANKDLYKATKSDYSGPGNASAVTGYDDLVNKSTDAKTRVGNLTSNLGQSARDTFGNQNYSAGANKLDSALLSRDSGAKATLANTGEKYKGINDLLNGVTNDTQARIDTNRINTSANQKLIGQQEDSVMAGQTSALQSKADVENLKAKNLNSIYSGTAPDAFSEMQQRSDSGMRGAQYDPNVDWHNFFNQGIGTATAGSVANPEEKAKFAALAGLMDRTDTLKAGQGFTQASFNRGGYDSAVSAEQAKRAAAQKVIDDKAAVDAQAAQNVSNTQTIGAKSSVPRIGAPMTSGIQDDIRVLSDDGFLKKYGVPKSAYDTPTGY